MTKKVFALIIALCMLSLFLTGCSNSQAGTFDSVENICRSVLNFRLEEMYIYENLPEGTVVENRKDDKIKSCKLCFEKPATVLGVHRAKWIEFIIKVEEKSYDFSDIAMMDSNVVMIRICLETDEDTDRRMCDNIRLTEKENGYDYKIIKDAVGNINMTYKNFIGNTAYFEYKNGYITVRNAAFTEL